METDLFQVRIEQESIDDLKDRLKRTRWPDEIADSGWKYGSNLEYVKELVDYWTNRFDWRAAEEKINAFHNCTATIDGMKIHFIHERGKGPNPTPLVITHG
ncbi:MAG: epoxide hydrolase N-terminal domain-containing protein, partial [Blastocatellia bacterium]